MFRMTVESQFSAAHAIRNYPGPCCRMHGHNYRVVVRLAGEELNALGMLIDYTDVKKALAMVLDPLDHTTLNERPEFSHVNTTSEELARLIYRRLRDILFADADVRRRVWLREVIVYESDRQGVGYGEEQHAAI